MNIFIGDQSCEGEAEKQPWLKNELPAGHDYILI